MARLLTILLGGTIVLTMSAHISAGIYSGGSGTVEDPYQISIPADMIALGNTPDDYGKSFILTSDIDMAGQGPNPDGSFFRALIAPDTNPLSGGYQGITFEGTFNGNGFTIRNLTINNINAGYLGLFGWIDNGAAIFNLGIESMKIVGSNTLGGLVGRSDLSEITDCYAIGSIAGEYAIGGLVGFNNSTIRKCYTAGSITGDIELGGLIGFNVHDIIQSYSTVSINGKDNSSKLGGLIGYDTGSWLDTVSQCYATGSVTGGIQSRDIGGLIGEVHGGSHINQCYATGNVSGSNTIGALVGYIYRGRISNSLCNLETQPSYVHNPLGYSQESSITNVFGKNISGLYTQVAYTDIGWDFIGENANGAEDYWRMCQDGIGYPKLSWEFSTVGDFSCPDSVKIEDLIHFAELWLMKDCVSANNYCGGTDINLSGIVDYADWAIFADNWLKP